MMKKILVSLLLLIPLASHAAIYPIPQKDDYRITRTPYNPENVIKVRTHIGVVTLIKFEDGETISEENGIGMGDVQAWGVFVNKNNLFIKPTSNVEPDTNLTIVTNKGRTYSFWLELSDFPHFIVQMVYQKQKDASSYPTNSPIPCYDGEVNFDYEMWGDRNIAPKYVWDDGRFTCLKFPDSNELPLVYQVDKKGVESAVNYDVKQDTIVVFSTSNELRLRLGKEVLGLASDSIKVKGFNDKATSIDAKRTVNRE
ncbi:TrbG/VirB9 family P-type conjugative transfer protein [Vibrio harveyi]|uniref:TrbG/VirB9 family P-type conjugative transfer protein n=1 Tax=Vibrio harveyi TaxID=669 RepID=UPI003CFAC2CD